MSTIPSTAVATEALTTAATEAGLDFGSIKEMMDAFDPAALLPDLSQMPDLVASVARLAVMAGPLVLLAMGLAYLFLSPKEANYRFGYRCFFGMGSVQAWRFTQRMAGLVWGGLGIVLTVIMGVISLGYGGKPIVDIVDSALTCLIWQIVLVAVSCVAINVVVMLCFDAKGALRKH